MIRTEVQQQQCPYTGLRSFTEDESLFFKGRDQQIGQIIDLLEQNKFLMVTGASGEGKSSVVYAGLIPNARAGFFKAKYTNWVVADFRPERSPLQRMSAALADKFSLQANTVETELKRGYSSLVDLYVNSAYYVDEQDENWQTQSENDKKNKKRGAANLLLIVDQFEEFFTNPENFHKEAPSQESQIVVNLILETARIALKRGLPIYVVCTMRSDYIGQCSAFRGLAEYIGFSQFFVPRLKRKDLKQVIEEPAILSGYKISQRLIERLVYDLSEGIDQLPILQHALSQVWLEADHGGEEMDLIHYAKVGGMPVDDLPTEDQVRFRDWFQNLPDFRRTLYSRTGLNRVIEIHANLLYESAHEIYQHRYPQAPLGAREVKRIVAIAFACLTKIDNSRAVRNRMTLGEITSIVNTPGITAQTVGRVLEVFREEGNSFIRPFKTDDPATFELGEDTVLDITHESLIRSWDKLNSWVSQEFEFYSNYLDLKKQLDRWKESGRSSNYLLPVGPLSFFENWFEKCRPNQGWIARYMDVAPEKTKREEAAAETLRDIITFLKSSARRVMVTRAFMKYGSQRIVAGLAMIVMVILSGYYWYDAEQKQTAHVIKSVKAEARSLLLSEFVNDPNKGFYLLVEEQETPGALLSFVEAQTDIRLQTKLATYSYFVMILNDLKFDKPLKHQLIQQLEKYFAKRDQTSIDVDQLMKDRTLYILLLAYDNYYNPAKDIAEELKLQAGLLFPIIKTRLQNPETAKPGLVTDVNQALQQWLTFGEPTQDQLQQLINIISPFESESGQKAFSAFFPQGSFESNGVRTLDYNGGYHTLASLYAAAGRTDGILQCFNAMKSLQDYWSARVFNNFANVMGYLYQYGHRDQVTQAVRWIHMNVNRSEESVYDELMIRSSYMSQLYRTNFNFNAATEQGNFYLNLCLADRSQFKAIAEDYERAVASLSNANERKYLMAIQLKRKAIFEFKWNFDRGMPQETDKWNSALAQSVSLYQAVDPRYLAEPMNVSYSFLGGTRTKQWSRRDAFLYPDFIGHWQLGTYQTDMFFKYLDRNKLIDKLFTSDADLNLIHLWLTNAVEVRPFFGFERLSHDQPLTQDLLLDVLRAVQHHANGSNFDRNLIYLELANRYLTEGDTVNGLKYHRLIDYAGIAQWSNKYEEIDMSYIVNEAKSLAGLMARMGRTRETFQIIQHLQTTEEQLFSYLHSAVKTYEHKQFELTFALMDSAYSRLNTLRLTDETPRRDARMDLISLLSRIGGAQFLSLAESLLKDLNEQRKVQGMNRMITGQALSGNYYKAHITIPSTYTDDQQLNSLTNILWGAGHEKDVHHDFKHIIDDSFNWDYIYFGSGSLN